MDFFDNHKRLYLTAFLFFSALTLLVAILPALDNQQNNAPLPTAEPMSPEAQLGKNIFISNGCVSCHTQQVRNIEMDRIWGERPGIPADYAALGRMDFFRNTATLMGTERTGPDLTHIGMRQPSQQWHLLHLYQPRAVVKASIMPAYPWLFELKERPGKNDVKLSLPEGFGPTGSGTLVASKQALYLVAYLQSLKQAKLPAAARPDFLYASSTAAKSLNKKSAGLDGKTIYSANCQSCHQGNGEGLKGTFPPLKGSPIVLSDNLEKYVDIILNGYDARAEYGVMPPVGTNMKFTELEMAALINYERSSWGNAGKQVSPAEVKAIMDLVKQKSSK